MQSPAFANVIIDFVGPFYIKHIPRRRKDCEENQLHNQTFNKTWILNFTCLRTGAIHLELTWGLTAEIVIQLFSNFVLVRGQIVGNSDENIINQIQSTNQIEDESNLVFNDLSEEPTQTDVDELAMNHFQMKKI